MAEDSMTSHGKYPKPKIPTTIPNLHVDTTKESPSSSQSMPSSPVALQKSNTVKRYTCMCSPTTHAGSFRCRYHRNAALKRNGMSMGSKLSELADKSRVACNKSPSELHRESLSSDFEFSFA